MRICDRSCECEVRATTIFITELLPKKMGKKKKTSLTNKVMSERICEVARSKLLIAITITNSYSWAHLVRSYYDTRLGMSYLKPSYYYSHCCPSVARIENHFYFRHLRKFAIPSIFCHCFQSCNLNLTNSSSLHPTL